MPASRMTSLASSDNRSRLPVTIAAAIAPASPPTILSMRRASALRPRSIAIMAEAASPGDSGAGTTSMRDLDDFDEIGQHLFDLIRGRCNVKPGDHILDIGSGCGRVAIPFTSYLSGGKYDGFDVVLPMVEWCR